MEHGMKTDATFSECRKYRYALWRIWDESKPYVMFIGLNPSTADETENDNTTNRCINYAKDWGYGRLCMANLFAFCTKDPDEMKAAKNPIDKDNDVWLKKLSNNAGVVIAAWGDDGSHLGRSKKVINMFPNLKCLKVNKSGEPAHPLYQPGTAVPIKMSI